jgi:oligogalacturonide lyase
MGRISRRTFLAGLPASRLLKAAGKGEQTAPAIRRYADPLTEREVWRLTPLSGVHHLPHGHQRFVARNNSFALLAGERGGEGQLLRMELPSGRTVQLTQGSGVATFSACLAPDENSCFFLQNGVLKQMPLRSMREREIYRVEPEWQVTGDLGVSIDGRFAALVEMRASDRVTTGTGEEQRQLQFARQPLCRIRVVETRTGKHWIVAEDNAWLIRPQLRPKRDQVLYGREGPAGQVSARIWLVNLDGQQKRALRPAEGEEEIGPAYWTTDGRLLVYVHYPDRSFRKATVRTFDPDRRDEQVLSPCTQFWRLRGNADNSALVGASRSVAGPNIYVLFPTTQRELTVCEHASTRKLYRLGPEEVPAAEPDPVFCADSQWVYFTSDREGVPAVYRAPVADWVEKT